LHSESPQTYWPVTFTFCDRGFRYALETLTIYH